MSNALTPSMTQDRDQLTGQSHFHESRNQDVDHLLDVIQNGNTTASRISAQQFMKFAAPTAETIQKVQAVLQEIVDPTLKSILEEGIASMTQAIESVWANKDTADALRFPDLCACCGVDGPLEEGQIFKRSTKQRIRFRWEKRDAISLTVPACEECKKRLENNTKLCMVMSCLLGVVFIGLLFWMVSLLAFILLLPWVWAGTTWLVKNVAHLVFSHPHGVIWPDLCTYDGEKVYFRNADFRKEFVALNT